MISVSIVTYHSETSELDACLASLGNPLVKKITIVDNGQEERLRKYCLGKPGVDYISLPNPGFGAAHNRALLSSDQPYHIILNSDVRFNPDILTKLADCMQRNPDVAQLQPKIYKADGSLQYGSRRLPSPWMLIGRRFLPEWIMKYSNRRYLLMDKDLDSPLNVPYQVGCFMMIRTAAAKAIGGFDERFFMYPEDIDLSRRLRQNHIVLYYPAVSIIHAHAAASYRNLRMLRIHADNMIRYFRKWGVWSDRQRRQFNGDVNSVTLL